jgi:phosphatidylethanolamine-binding protein (PEBP) family uncharacterized protein
MLVVAGCGGDSDAQTASTSRPAKTAAAAQADGAPTGSPAGDSSAAGNTKSSTTPSGSSSSSIPASPDASGGGKKQGSRIAVPKGAPEHGPTPTERAQATVADISMTSPALEAATGSSSALPAAYTCDGAGSWPALQWHGIPPGTVELALFAINVAPVEGKLFFDWAVAGLDPSLEGLEAGRLPKGAITGRNGYGHTDYEICPPEGKAETYVFLLFALPKSLSPSKGFDARQLRDEALQLSGNAGLLAASYTRG